MALFRWKKRDKVAAPPVRKMSKIDKAIDRLSRGYLLLPEIERRTTLELVHSIWTIVDNAKLPNLSELLWPFIAAIALPIVGKSRTLGAEIVLALDRYGGQLRADLSFQIGGPHAWPGKVEAAREELRQAGKDAA
jgi:hypothetical protein